VWRYSGLVFLAYAVCAGAIGFGTGLYSLEPRLDLNLLRIALIALAIPALGEEVFFRGFLVPTAAQATNALPQMVLALIIFLTWHPLNAWLLFPAVLPLFSDWRFLLVTACLGVSCTHLWRKTGSLWPPIAVHWLAVVIWKGFLGAPQML
jgi:predicted Abi (CAAX) family protease